MIGTVSWLVFSTHRQSSSEPNAFDFGQIFKCPLMNLLRFPHNTGQLSLLRGNHESLASVPVEDTTQIANNSFDEKKSCHKTDNRGCPAWRERQEKMQQFMKQITRVKSAWSIGHFRLVALLCHPRTRTTPRRLTRHGIAH